MQPRAAAPPRIEQRATTKLLAAPALIPHPEALLSRDGKAGRRRQLLLRAQDSLHRSCEWARETLLPASAAVPTAGPAAGVGGGDRADPTEDHASLVAKLAEWHDRGQRECAAMSEAHTSEMRCMREESVRLGGDLGRLKKRPRLTEVVAAAREREHAHPSLSLRPAAPTAGPAANNGVASTPTGGMVML